MNDGNPFGVARVKDNLSECVPEVRVEYAGQSPPPVPEKEAKLETPRL